MTPLTPAGAAVARFLGQPAQTPGQAPSVDEEGFEAAYLGWELARCANSLTAEEKSALAAIAAACIASTQAGSTRMPIDGHSFRTALGLIGAADLAPCALRVVERARAQHAGDPITSVIGRAGERKPLVVEGSWIYLERMRVLEARFCARVRALLAQPTAAQDDRAIRRALTAAGAAGLNLTSEQQGAIRRALREPLTLISGGPGTGKTTVIVAIVRLLQWMGAPVSGVAVAAPTGKAAQRLTEALRARAGDPNPDLLGSAVQSQAPLPQTLHRLLGWSPSAGRFTRHEGDPLSQRMIVVDEASMIDLVMMDRLVRALPDGARLVLVGDADQLPSVEAGAVFRDMCAALKPVTLTTNLRVARESAPPIVDAARAVNSGDLGHALTVRRSVDQLAFEGVEHLDARWADVGPSVLDQWWRRRLGDDEASARWAGRSFNLGAAGFDESDRREIQAMFEHFARARILCATRYGGAPASVSSINEALVAMARPAGGREDRGQLVTGAPVVLERNDYGRGLFNGDQGVIANVRGLDGEASRGAWGEQALPPNTGCAAIFLRSGVPYAVEASSLTDLSLAFAMTVHKAQGSEFDHVALVLPDADLPLLTRELVYTAITRARRSVLIVAEAELLKRAVSRTVERYSGVAERFSSLSG
jgi:exodeoxyribonuclease V alpha subunit